MKRHGIEERTLLVTRDVAPLPTRLFDKPGVGEAVSRREIVKWQREHSSSVPQVCTQSHVSTGPVYH